MLLLPEYNYQHGVALPYVYGKTLSWKLGKEINVVGVTKVTNKQTVPVHVQEYVFLIVSLGCSFQRRLTVRNVHDYALFLLCYETNDNVFAIGGYLAGRLVKFIGDHVGGHHIDTYL